MLRKRIFLIVFGVLLVGMTLSSFGGVNGRSLQSSTPIYLPIINTVRQFEANPTAHTFANVTDITNAGDERLFVAELSGIIYVIQENGTKSVFLDIRDRVDADGYELGMFGLAFHPNHLDNGYFYVTYTASAGDMQWKLILAQFQVTADPNVADPSSEARLVSVTEDSEYHNGGSIEFNPIDGRLYFGIGDDSQNLSAQEANQNKGHLLRIGVNPTRIAQNRNNSLIQISADTFAAQDVSIQKWAKGLRNPWRIAIDPLTGDIFIGDVGDRDWEEINYIPFGVQSKNFGWPCMEGPNIELTDPPCDKSFDAPLYYYDEGCSVVMGEVYRFNNDPKMPREIIFTDGCLRHINVLKQTSNGWVAEEIGTIPETPSGFLTTFGKDNNGKIFAGLLGSPVPLYELYIPAEEDR